MGKIVGLVINKKNPIELEPGTSENVENQTELEPGTSENENKNTEIRKKVK